MLEAIKALGKNATDVADIVQSFLITNVDSQTSEVFKINLLQISYRQTRKEKDSWVIENAIRGYDNDEFSTSALQVSKTFLVQDVPFSLYVYQLLTLSIPPLVFYS